MKSKEVQALTLSILLAVSLSYLLGFLSSTSKINNYEWVTLSFLSIIAIIFLIYAVLGLPFEKKVAVIIKHICLVIIVFLPFVVQKTIEENAQIWMLSYFCITTVSMSVWGYIENKIEKNKGGHNVLVIGICLFIVSLCFLISKIGRYLQNA